MTGYITPPPALQRDRAPSGTFALKIGCTKWPSMLNLQIDIDININVKVNTIGRRDGRSGLCTP